MKKKNMTAGLLIVVLLLGLCSACGRDSTAAQREPAAASRQRVIGVTLADESTYLSRIAKVMKQTAQDNDVRLNIKAANWDSDVQARQIMDFIRRGVNAIVVAPVDAKAVLTPLKAAKIAGIPVINVNMKVDNISTEYIKTYVGASSEEEGEKAAQLMEQQLGSAGGKIGIVEGSPGSDPQIYRTKAFLDIVNKKENLAVVGIGNGAWKRDKARLVAIDLMGKNPDIKGIYCHDSEMAMGVVAALKEMGKLSQVKIISIAENEEYIRALKAGELAGIVTQPPEFEGKYSIYTALWAMQGTTLKPWYKNPITVLTRTSGE